MKAFVAVFAGIAAASAAPEADPYLYAAHPVYLGDAHTQTSKDLVEYPNGAKVPDNTLSVKAAGTDHLLAKALQTPWWYHPLGKREAEAKPEAKADPFYGIYGYGVAPYAVAPVVEDKDTGLIFSHGSGAITPAFTKEQVEADPAIAEGSEAIKVPVVTGFNHYLGKREAEAEAEPGLIHHWNGAITPDYTHAQKVVALDHFLAHGYPLYHYLGKREAEAKPYYGLGYGGYYGLVHAGGAYTFGYGKRSADPYYGVGYGYGYGYGLVPEVKPKDSGLIFTASSGAITPAFTEEQVETNPEIAKGSESIKVPALTGKFHLIGKREAEAKPYYYGLGGYGGYYGGYGLGSYAYLG